MSRIVYSILVKIDSPGQLVELVIPLTRYGQSPVVSGGPSMQRVVDLRPGDTFTHLPTGKRHRIKSMQAYRDLHIGGGQPASYDGWIVP